MRNLPIDPSTSEIQPWHSLGGAEFICQLRKSSMVLYGIFVEILRAFYSDKSGRLIGTPDVVWSKKGTGLWIDSELRWEDQHPEVRPAIYVQLSPIQYTQFIPNMNGQLNSADRFAKRHYELKGSGSVTFMHVASTSGEACYLADNTEYCLMSMQDPISQDFCFEDFVSVGRTPLEKLPKEASDKYASGVTFSYTFIDSWDTKEECPILKAIDLIDGSTNEDSGHEHIKHDNIFTENKVPVNTGIK